MHIVVDSRSCAASSGGSGTAGRHPRRSRYRRNAVAITLAPRVMAVLAHLDHQHARAAAFGLGEGLHVLLGSRQSLRRLRRRRRKPPASVLTSARWRPNSFSIAMLISPHRGPGARGLDRRLEQVAALARAPRELFQRLRASAVIAAGAYPFQPRDLAVADLDIVDIQDVDRVLGLLAILVDADDHLVAPVDHRLARGRAFLRSAAWAARWPRPWSCRPFPRPPRFRAQALSASSAVRLST